MINNKYLLAGKAIIYRELLLFIKQKAKFFAALVRPLVWLFIFAVGFRSILGMAIIPPYQTYILYETYIVPGLCSVILLFGAMQSSLSIIHDREYGSFNLLMCVPLPRWYLIICKTLSTVFIYIIQVFIFLALANIVEVRISIMGYIQVLPMLILAGSMFTFMGMIIASLIKQIENFAGVMNFIIFPMFFASSALYPLWRIKESSDFLHLLATYNPFTHVTELIRFAIYEQTNWSSLQIIVMLVVIFFVITISIYQPIKRSKMRKRG